MIIIFFITGVIDSIIVCFYVTICVAGVSLHHGFCGVTRRFGRLLITVYVLSFVVARTASHYLDSDYDVEISLIKGQKISVRSVIVSKGFDLFIWFSYSCWNIITKPQTLLLRSKIELKWIS